MSNPRSPSVSLSFSLGTTTIKVLEIPRAQFSNYSFYPLKWLRFVGYAVYGAEGDIYEIECEDPIDYESITEPEDLSDGYRFISLDEPHLVDVNAIGSCVSLTSSLSTIGRKTFHEVIMARDGGCVLIGDPRLPSKNTGACHILPFSKSDTYIKAVIEERSKDSDGVVQDINDVRNGVTLKDCFHGELRRGLLAFLVTPNFALGTEDVAKAKPTRSSRTSTLESSSNDDGFRYTLHHFPGIDSMYAELAPPGTDARFSCPPSDRPSALILDFWYGCVAIQAWGQPSFRDFVERNTNQAYYSSDQIIRPSSGESRRQKHEEKLDRRELRRARRAPEIHKVLDLMLALTNLQHRERREKYKEEIEARLQQEEIDRQQRTLAKVNDWRQRVYGDLDDSS